MKYWILSLACTGFLFVACNEAPAPPATPENFEDLEEEGPGKDSLKNIYLSELYYAAPGTNVDSIRYENWKKAYAQKQVLHQEAGARSVAETFANGLIEGIWHERGPNNEAGDMRVIDFDPTSQNFYALSTVGHLWKGNLDGLNWTKLNDDIRFRTEVISILPQGAGQRIFAVYGAGVDNKKIRFSDDEGQTWTTGTGFSFYDHWGKGRRLVTLSDNQTLYYLVHTWSNSPWGQLIQLYKSTDKGVTYTKVWDTPVDYTVEDVDLWKPYDSNQMFLIDNKTQKYYEVTHNMGTGATTISAPVSYASQGIATGAVHLSGRFNNSLNDYELFLMHESSKNVYKSSNGSTWTFLSTAPESVWVKGWLADPDNNNLYIGGFQLNKTSNGINWTEQYPQWWRYYSHSKDSMHVDIMNLEYFQKSNGDPFIIILNHAGVHITYDHFATTANLGLANLNVVTLYDQTTAGDGFLYCGAQDKGNFKYSGNSLSGYGLLSTDNMSTADGMLGVFFNSDQSFYAMIQNGTLYCFKDRDIRSSSSWTIPGTNKPGWINPIVPTPDFTDNKAYVAGGNLNGGSGSYLILANVNITSGVSWQNTQYNYDFRANSNNGTSVIKAIGVAMSDFDRIYVATQDATFFSSADHGSSWSKLTTAGLPGTLLPWDIKTSNTNADKVFICGTGFSNPGVYQSSNAGVTFTPVTGNAPLATYYEIALSDNEDYLFAATSEGPYVYVFAESLWYSLMGADTPIADFNTVDNVGNNRIRFGTYGRGIWDLELTSLPLPVELTAFTARPLDTNKSQLSWTTASEKNVRDFVVEHSSDGIHFKSIGTVLAIGNSTQSHTYPFVHNTPVKGNNFYRLQIRDEDGVTRYSDVKLVHFEEIIAPFKVYPNVLTQNSILHVQPQNAGDYTLEIYDANGRAVWQSQQSGPFNLPVNMAIGVYVYHIRAGQQVVSGKILVQ